MSIWGDADSDELPDNPFHVDQNWYWALCTELYELDKDGVTTLNIKWKIEESDSAFDGLPVNEKHTLFKVPVDQMSPKERQRMSFTKKRLREAFDLTPDELKKFVPKDGLGKYAFIHVINTPDKNDSSVTYNNVRSALCRRLYDEQIRQGESEDSSIVDI